MNDVVAKTPHPRPDAAESEALSRALIFIEGHCSQPISILALAEASGVTPRALQYAFRRSLHVTPSQYLRQVRLDRVRNELRLADRDGGTTVTEVAMRWGFYHQGRFAAAYRRRFGEAPHETLSTAD